MRILFGFAIFFALLMAINTPAPCSSCNSIGQDCWTDADCDDSFFCECHETWDLERYCIESGY